jgi:parallel beta-helix repeat protein
MVNQAVQKVGDAGLKFTRAHGNQILNNTVRAASDCSVFLEFSNNSVRGNDVQFNPCGIDLAHADGNRVERNNAGNTTSTWKIHRPMVSVPTPQAATARREFTSSAKPTSLAGT